ncbi:MAG: hypothetical protein LBK91_01890 [Synergistaceae bacterium]|nr:hypothetical protein [Synergistaceae bacterium]
MSRYFGAGSWLWFPAAAMSLLLQSDDGMKFRVARRVTAACNIGAIVAAICVFMLNMGIPGDIPSIEGISAITALDSIRDAKIICAFALFFVSAVMSFACAFNPACPSRASRLLSFSCSSFLALALVPPAHVFLRDFTPRSALFMDMAFYFLEAETLHFIVFKELYQPIVSKWRYSFVTVNAAFTLAGIYFLFSIAKN